MDVADDAFGMVLLILAAIFVGFCLFSRWMAAKEIRSFGAGALRTVIRMGLGFVKSIPSGVQTPQSLPPTVVKDARVHGTMCKKMNTGQQKQLPGRTGQGLIANEERVMYTVLQQEIMNINGNREDNSVVEHYRTLLVDKIAVHDTDMPRPRARFLSEAEIVRVNIGPIEACLQIKAKGKAACIHMMNACKDRYKTVQVGQKTEHHLLVYTKLFDVLAGSGFYDAQSQDDTSICQLWHTNNVPVIYEQDATIDVISVQFAGNPSPKKLTVMFMNAIKAAALKGYDHIVVSACANDGEVVRCVSDIVQDNAWASCFKTIVLAPSFGSTRNE